MKTTSSTTVQTTTSTLVGIAVISAGLIAAAAGFVMTAQNLGPVLNIQPARVPTSHAAVIGARMEPMLGGTIEAKNAPITVNDLTFNVLADSDGNFATIENDISAQDVIESCVLTNNQNGAVFMGPIPVTDGSILHFTDDFFLTANSIINFTVKCDIAHTTINTPFIIGVELTNYPGYVVATNTNNSTAIPASRIRLGRSTDPGINITLSTAVTIKGHGGISAARSNNTPSADFVLAPSSSNTVAKYQFTASQEAFTIETLSVSEEQAEDDTGTPDSAAYANNISLVTLTYPKADGSTATTTASVSGNVAKFSGISMYVAPGLPAEVSVSVGVPNSDRYNGGSATSNEKIRLGLFVNKTSNDGFKAIGSSSGATVNDQDIRAIGSNPFSLDGIATFVVREAKPTISLASSSPSGSAVAGRGEVLRLNVAASANEDLVLNSIMFKLSSTDNAGTAWNKLCAPGNISASDFDLYNYTKHGTSQTIESSDAEWSFYDASGATLTCPSTSVVAFAKLTMKTPEIITKGTTNSFALYFDSTGASPSMDDSIRFDLQTDPIVSNFLPGGVVSDTSLVRGDSTITMLQSNGFQVGDVICFSGSDTTCDSNEERAFVTGTNGNDITIARGYLGSNVQRILNGQFVLRLPGSLLWQDDGSSSVANSSQEYWGSYLVDNLTINGGTLVF